MIVIHMQKVLAFELGALIAIVIVVLFKKGNILVIDCLFIFGISHVLMLGILAVHKLLTGVQFVW